MTPKVTFIIPAFNAEEHIEDAVSSVVRQSVSNWELIIVDDGSTDDTVDLVSNFVQSDDRIRLVSKVNGGVSSARNVGLEEARAEWVVFLDSDDWIDANFLKKLLKRARFLRVDAVFCSAVDVTSEGVEGKYWSGPTNGDLFPLFAYDCPIAVHCIMVKRDLVIEIGGWDTTLATCEDWDLWQRIGRSGAKYATVPEVLSYVRLRPGSLSRTAASTLARDGRIVIERGHEADQRVAKPEKSWENGMPKTDLAHSLALHTAWASALDIAVGGTGLDIIGSNSDVGFEEIEPFELAATIHDAVSHGTGRVQDNWDLFFPRVLAMLKEIETNSGTPKLSMRTQRSLETLAFRHARLKSMKRLGSTIWISLDLEEPIQPVEVPSNVEQLVIVCFFDNKRIGTITLPVYNERVLKAQILSAAAERFGAKLLLHVIQNGKIFSPYIVASAARILIRRRTLRFLLSIIQLNRRSQVDRLRQFAILVGNEISISGKILTSSTSSPDERQKASVNGKTERNEAQLQSNPVVSYSSNYWEQIFADEDPWKYDNKYEQKKYRQTIDALDGQKFNRALELACAEGHFTELLAQHVKLLHATDISENALARAEKRCNVANNVEFSRLDIRNDSIDGEYDLIICSEVLYYFERRSELRKIARKLASHLKFGGVLLMAHAKIASNAPHETGFDWDHPYDAREIGRVFANIATLHLASEYDCDLYRISKFERSEEQHRAPVKKVQIKRTSELGMHVSSQIEWNGAAAYKSIEVTDHLPILTYHRVAENGHDELRKYRISPKQFDEQLAYLSSQGYYGTTINSWLRVRSRARGLPGRAVLITFDDAYCDFLDQAWPILQKYGFGATVFVPTNFIGGAANWDSRYGEPSTLLTWSQIRELSSQGVQFGSHTCSHPLLTTLSPKEIQVEAEKSRDVLEQQLGISIDSVAYPFGDHSEVVQRVFQDVGYVAGFTCGGAASSLYERAMRMSRIELSPNDGPAEMKKILPETRPCNFIRDAKVKSVRSMQKFVRRVT